MSGRKTSPADQQAAEFAASRLGWWTNRTLRDHRDPVRSLADVVRSMTAELAAELALPRTPPERRAAILVRLALLEAISRPQPTATEPAPLEPVTEIGTRR